MNKFFTLLSITAVLMFSAGAPVLRAQDATDGTGTTVGTDPTDDDSDTADDGSTTTDDGSGTTDDGSTTTDDGPVTTDPIIFETLTNIGVLPPLYFFVNYSGTVTQMTAAGAATTGTMTLNVKGNGKVFGVITLNGTSTNYVGFIRRKAIQKRNGTGSGYMMPADESFHRIVGSSKIPLVVEKGVFQGGTLDEAGSMLVFRGTVDSIQPASTGSIHGK